MIALVMEQSSVRARVNGRRTCLVLARNQGRDDEHHGGTTQHECITFFPISSLPLVFAYLPSRLYLSKSTTQLVVHI